MKAQQVIDGASFGPDALKAMGLAFDQAWAEVKGDFGTDPRTVEDVRLRLAKALLSIASDGRVPGCGVGGGRRCAQGAP